MTVVINRPWISSFSFSAAGYTNDKLEQVHKLARNFVASLDLGCPHVRHVNAERKTEDREKYLQWVANWKVVYAETSKLIRQMKSWRKTVKFQPLTAEQAKVYESWNRGSNTPPAQQLNQLSHRHLERMQETAQVLLNARYNAKLAAGMRRQRALAERDAKEGERKAA